MLKFSAYGTMFHKEMIYRCTDKEEPVVLKFVKKTVSNADSLHATYMTNI